jgi:hypothetical protein
VADYGYLAAQMEAPPEKLASFFAASHEIAADLASKPISEDELNRARRPTLEGIDRARDGNGYWLGALGDLAKTRSRSRPSLPSVPTSRPSPRQRCRKPPVAFYCRPPPTASAWSRARRQHREPLEACLSPHCRAGKD